MSEIQLKDTVYNIEVFDSSEDEEDENFEIIDENNEYDTADEDTDDLGEKLQELLGEVAIVDVVGKKAFRLDFSDANNLEFADKNEDCDFDTDERGIPIMPDGGEEFLLPYMKQICKKMPEFKKCILETNARGQKFKI